MHKSYPVGRAQWQVCKALGHTEIETYEEAEELFKHVGIVVIPVRQGRTSVPSVSIKRGGYAWNAGGDADVWGGTSLTPEQRSAIEQWMSK